MTKKFLLIVFLLTCQTLSSFAQCAMCRATVENNISNGENSLGSGLNTGILYLLSMPYLAITLLAYLWYRHSKNKKKQFKLLIEK
ncbi:MAG: hypothetical protein EAZ97_12645 [Bacteroidetes bacterium]|nr:MAG: hypothetical protein EAZ97_12645 [Bacteroidota bacterium]